MNRKLLIAAVAVILIGVVLSDTLFTVGETEQALIIQFGEPKEVIQEPGLQVKLPFVQNVVKYEKRVLDVDPPVEQVILADQRRLDVDAFVRYRIVDPLQFYQTVTNEVIARQRLATFTNAALRRVLGNVTQLEILSEERANIMNAIKAAVATEARPLGVEIVDVRIVRADVPEGTVQSVYDRMRSEREREAAEFRAQGFEQAQQIRARADRERTVLLAEAAREAQVLRGEGDANSIRISAEAFSQDADFFTFYRTLEAYRQSLRDDDTTLVLSPSGDYFRFFQNPDGGEGPMSAGLMDSIRGAAGGQVPSAPAADGQPQAGTVPEAGPSEEDEAARVAGEPAGTPAAQ